jgi:polyribonucleotide nucleotidyltransferase
MTLNRFETQFADQKVIIETGRMALQTSASVTVQMGDTVVMATAILSKNASTRDFFPLMVDYEERYFAGGKIKGSRFSKREGRPTSEAILTGRMIDRGVRPLFIQDMRNEVQVICIPLSFDYENKPDIVAMLAACTALHISEIPFDGPVVGVRVGMVNGQYIINPNVDELEFSDLKLTIMGDGERVTMVECNVNEVEDAQVKEAFTFAMEAMKPITAFIDDIRSKIGKPKLTEEELSMATDHSPEEKELIEEIKKAAIPHLDKYLFNTPKGSKRDRMEILEALEEILVKEFTPKHITPERDEEATTEYLTALIHGFFKDFIEEQVTLAILDKDQRVDGRALDEVRPLSSEVGILPRTHGSGLFSRGETQILSVVTLGAPFDEESIETMETEGTKKYFHHYNFLPYCVGEVKPIRGAGRREIGHGQLAEKAIVPLLPDAEEFPYTIRVVSEVLGSNGSSSMGSTCGSTLALMDAGVPIKRPVAGIAMGLASDGKRWKVISDIQDLEDGPGGMDFKFTSTSIGITAIQMDTKTRGLTKEMIEATFPMMRKSISDLLDNMTAAIPEPRKELSQYAPRIIHFMIDPEKIRDVIGPGGKVIRSITDELDLKIDIEDDGMVMITTTDVKNGEEAEKRIRDIVRVVEVGEVFENAEVVNILQFKAFINLTPGTDGMLHISNIEWGRVERITDRIKVGDKVNVKVIKIERGLVEVSMKDLTPKPEGYREPQRRPRSGPPRGGRPGGGRRDGGDRRGGGGGGRGRPPPRR